MGPIVSWTPYAGIIEFDFDHLITTEPTTHVIGNDTHLITDIVDEQILTTGLELAKRFGYTSVEFSDTKMTFIGHLPTEDFVQQVVTAFSAWSGIKPHDVVRLPDASDPDYLGFDEDHNSEWVGHRDTTPLGWALDVY